MYFVFFERKKLCIFRRAEALPNPQGATVNEASITNADATVGSLTVHTIDEVLFPPWSAPAKVLTPQQVLAFEGWAPEVINGRLAMLGFLTCVVQAGSHPSNHVLAYSLE